MNAATAHLVARTIQAHARVERTLTGMRPRSFAKRIRHLLRPASETVIEYTPVKDGPPQPVELHLSRLGLAGHLRMASWRALEESLKSKLQVNS